MRVQAARTSGRLGAALALFGLLGWCWRRLGAVHRDRLGSRPAALPEPLQVWEGEGGPEPGAPPSVSPESRKGPTPGRAIG
jgi:hypothetical protein